MSNHIDYAEAFETEAMTVQFDGLGALSEREQRIYNAAYIKGRRDYAREMIPA